MNEDTWRVGGGGVSSSSSSEATRGGSSVKQDSRFKRRNTNLKQENLKKLRKQDENEAEGETIQEGKLIFIEDGNIMKKKMVKKIGKERLYWPQMVFYSTTNRNSNKNNNKNNNNNNNNPGCSRKITNQTLRVSKHLKLHHENNVF